MILHSSEEDASQAGLGSFRGRWVIKPTGMRKEALSDTSFPLLYQSCCSAIDGGPNRGEGGTPIGTLVEGEDLRK